MEQFTQFLIGEGYAAPTITAKRGLARELSIWMKRSGLSLTRLDENHIKHFHSHRRRRARCHGQRSSAQLLRFLRGLGVTSPPQPRTDNSLPASLTRDYESYLYSERGLSHASVVRYMPVARRFLDTIVTGKRKSLQDGLRDLVPKDLNRFILREAKRVSRVHAKCAVTALRSFLRFLLQHGMIQVDLAAALPSVAYWRLSDIPKSLTREDIELVLSSCDRNTPAGGRDYAILSLLAGLGLRSGEVLALTLDDIDWKQGELLVRGKGQRFEILPLPRDAGVAVAHYLRHARPHCSTRKVFVRLKAPWQPLGQTAICSVVRRALMRSGLNPAFKGAHLFRHSLATNMIRQGAGLGEIGQILRHSHPATTQIYAKVDIEGLRDIALPWMEGAS